MVYMYHSLEQHRNMYTIKGETDYRPRLDAWDKRSDLVLWEDLEGAGGEGGGRGNRDGEDMWTQGRFISMYDKIHYKLKKKKRKYKWINEWMYYVVPSYSYRIVYFHGHWFYNYNKLI